MNYVTDIDRERALLLIDAAIQAYNSFSKNKPTECQKAKIQVPAGFDFVECWTGTDSVFSKDRTVEVYGVVFRSSQAPYTYVFAFRGTDSPLDIIDDLGAAHDSFVPFDKTVAVDSGVKVEAGFWGVYTESGAGAPSMQQQVFALVDKYNASDKPIHELFITGHSLGSSLCELFTLDIALSRPEVTASNYNYACPRVGNSEFVKCYDSQAAQKNPETRTIRVQNTHDYIPEVPLVAMGYQHTPYAFLVSFYKYTPWWPHVDLNAVVNNHASGHYQAVLKCAFANESDVCVNNKLPVPGSKIFLTSGEPDPKEIRSSKKGMRRLLGI